jgi:hypothetical protein
VTRESWLVQCVEQTEGEEVRVHLTLGCGGTMVRLGTIVRACGKRTKDVGWWCVGDGADGCTCITAGVIVTRGVRYKE